MMQVNESKAEGWVRVCALDDILPDTGVCCLVGREQVALFRVGKGERLYAIGNFDPFSRANVLSRGIVGDRAGKVKVASPVYKQSFCLESGICLDDPNVSVPVYEVRLISGMIELRRAATRPLRSGNIGLVSEIQSA
jgi:nitrite reductase (NADH) small subunit